MKAEWPLTVVFELQRQRVAKYLLTVRGGASVPVERPVFKQVHRTNRNTLHALRRLGWTVRRES